MPRISPAAGTTLILTALLAAGVSGIASGQVYRWVDESGQLHLSDTPPPDSARYDREVLDRRGLVIQRLERARTSEELAAEQAERERLEALEQQRAEQERIDRILLQSFGSERELLHARDDRVALIEANMNLTRDKLVNLREQLTQTETRIAGLEAGGRPVPEGLREQTDSLRRQIRGQEEYLEERRQERDAVLDRFARDLARFRELRRRQADPQPPR
ncbi:DUF4124 domain-containing protein [Ectothiorhodospira lacustris]|uniref:DUF4124 domain-containing protein n=1 Tax=Ectothiorhodospira lacustris TaxID=2899127 RepID=UPI001EE95909|nr:DUF4124 domain-containing protein [Ectothiorhodospira lacustris]MCG5499229.1 DUF4124 domain-containing protein [Ectothiorhodospira lacustris]MCG5509723.1 DUF4124 domain-containing protein [Ectothiorhodospira lacustris]MCG5522363.1 DUF4124 domain-containing protein [Ectothiorhodospira lacustris]